MSKISCTDYSSKICTELNWNEPNVIFYFISFALIVVCMYWYCVLCLAAFWQLLIIINKRISINQASGRPATFISLLRQKLKRTQRQNTTISKYHINAQRSISQQTKWRLAYKAENRLQVCPGASNPPPDGRSTPTSDTMKHNSPCLAEHGDTILLFALWFGYSNDEGVRISAISTMCCLHKHTVTLVS